MQNILVSSCLLVLIACLVSRLVLDPEVLPLVGENKHGCWLASAACSKPPGVKLKL
jgi:hypothetical protein